MLTVFEVIYTSLCQRCRFFVVLNDVMQELLKVVSLSPDRLPFESIYNFSKSKTRFFTNVIQSSRFDNCLAQLKVQLFKTPVLTLFTPFSTFFRINKGGGEQIEWILVMPSLHKVCFHVLSQSLRISKKKPIFPEWLRSIYEDSNWSKNRCKFCEFQTHSKQWYSWVILDSLLSQTKESFTLARCKWMNPENLKADYSPYDDDCLKSVHIISIKTTNLHKMIRIDLADIFKFH